VRGALGRRRVCIPFQEGGFSSGPYGGACMRPPGSFDGRERGRGDRRNRPGRSGSNRPDRGSGGACACRLPAPARRPAQICVRRQSPQAGGGPLLTRAHRPRTESLPPGRAPTSTRAPRRAGVRPFLAPKPASVVTSDFVAILDADDVYFPERLEALGELAAARPDLDILTSDAYLELNGRRIRRCYEGGWTFEVEDQRRAILERNFIFGLAAVRR